MEPINRGRGFRYVIITFLFTSPYVLFLLAPVTSCQLLVPDRLYYLIVFFFVADSSYFQAIVIRKLWLHTMLLYCAMQTNTYISL